ncbi:type IV pilus biogenesis/stability protein PilW [Vibrio sp. WXL103]|uniref:type IV pilus biogenesis/stability protein PilW n=1 Tax=Vibrio sp. WXL103 TaxID=3450710 RepID=UPI003EC6A4EA
MNTFRIILLTIPFSLVACTTTDRYAINQSNPVKHEQADARIALGLSYIRQQQMPKAQYNLSLAIEHAPDYYKAQLALAYYFEQVNEPQQAQAIYHRAHKSHPNNGFVLNNYANYLCRHGDYMHAKTLLEQALATSAYPASVVTLENAALCSLKAGNQTQARHYFQRVFDHDPNRIDAALQLARLDIESGELSLARQRLLPIYRLQPQRRDTLTLLVELETQDNNRTMQQYYQSKLDSLKPSQ